MRIIKSEPDPETPELMAASIVKISEAMTRLAGQGGVTEDGIAALIRNMKGNSELRKEDIMLVMESLKRLRSYYIR